MNYNGRALIRITYLVVTLALLVSPVAGSESARAGSFRWFEPLQLWPGTGNLLGLNAAPFAALPQTFVVTNTSDSGAGSLRQAILDANARPGGDIISFNIPGTGPHKIQPLTPLPNISSPVLIDGYTQPDAAMNTLAAGTNAVIQIQLDGMLMNAGAGDGLTFAAGATTDAEASTVRGVSITRFRHGVLTYAPRLFVNGNFLGIEPDGLTPQGNDFAGVYVQAPGVVIGTNGDGVDDLAERNLISGNYGASNLGNIRVQSTNATVIAGNLIGTDRTGTLAKPSLTPSRWTNNVPCVNGVSLESAHGVRVGTNGDGIADAAERNVISGNANSGGCGYGITTWASNNAVVAGNLIGTDVTGLLPIPNGHGVSFHGYSENGRIGTDGNGVGDAAERNVISGNQSVGVHLNLTHNGHLVAGNFIGTDITGTRALGNLHGVYSTHGSYNIRVGGTTPALRNIISGNSNNGVWLNDAAHSVLGNYIGTDVTGSQAVPNGFGVNLSGNTIVGNGQPGGGNLISGNSGQGVYVMGAANKVQGNLIGTDVAGTRKLPNGGSGVYITGSKNNLIGGSNDLERNVISGNTGPGVTVQHYNLNGFIAPSDSNTVAGNLIGTDAGATLLLGNGGNGVSITLSTATRVTGNTIVDNAIGIAISSGATDSVITSNYIGTTEARGSGFGNRSHGIDIRLRSSRNNIGDGSAGGGNVIAHNTGSGVTVADPGTLNDFSKGNLISANSIFNNGQLGIDLSTGSDSGVTANDSQDPDEGANRVQNHPLAPASSGGLWSLNSTPNTTFRIEFFGNAQPDPSGSGEGQVFLGTTTVTTDASGNATFTPTMASDSAHPYISATATDPQNNTSEFSTTGAAQAPQAGGCSTTLTVPGTSNPWLAGMPAGSSDNGWDAAPGQSPVLASGIDVSGGMVISATGSVGNCPGCNAPSPEGGGSTPHASGASNGIAQVTAPINSLIGVFLDDSRPDLSPAPAALDFSTAQSRDYQTISPALKQPFFIGDGRTSGGTAQQIVVPAGAKRLYLGTMDGFGWYNNVGSFNVSITKQNCSATCSGAMTVPGTSNPWLAGMPAGSTAVNNDKAPEQSPALVGALRIAPDAQYTFEATGGVHYVGGGSLYPPDGFGGGGHGAENGIAALNAPWNSLIGVFLDDSQPSLSAAPAGLNFSTAASQNYASLSPQLKQPFFIGDGLNSSGLRQTVVAPAGATRLYLGTMDGSGWFNNVGSFNVTVTGACSTTPQPCGTSTTSPGGVFVTAQDPDFHAVQGGNATGAQHILQRAIAYVTGGKTNPRILLVTDLQSPGGVNSDPRLGLQASGFNTFDVADHGSGQQGALNLQTVSFTNYDVIVVASDFGGWLRQDELDILNARRNEIVAYVNGGGGLVALAESGQNIHSGAAIQTTTHSRYGFLPFLTSNVAHDQANTANTLTPAGLALGLTNSDLNGNFTHNYFSSTGGMDVIEVDGAGRIITLATRQRIGAGGVQQCGTEPPVVTTGPAEGSLVGPGIAGQPGVVRTTFGGTGNAGCTIRATVNDPDHGNVGTFETTVDASGNWSLDFDLHDCDPTIEFVQICGGVESEPVRRHIYVDGTPPQFTSGGPAEDGEIFIGGGGTSAEVVITGGGATDPDTSHCPDGNCGGLSYTWRCLGCGPNGTDIIIGGGGAGGTLIDGGGGLGSGMKIELGEGEYEFELTVCDAAGNCITKRCRRRVTRPRPVTLDSGLPADGGVMGPGGGYTVVSPGRVKTRLVGTGNPGCTIKVSVSDPDHPESASNNATYTATVDASGNWALDLELDDCHPVIEITQECDGVGGEVIRRQIYVDGTPPRFIDGSGPGDGVHYIGGGGFSTVTLVGAGTDEGSHVGGGVSYKWRCLGCGPNGTDIEFGEGGSYWRLINGGSGLEVDLQPGSYEIEVEVCDAAGNCVRKRCRQVVRRPVTLTSGLPQTGGVMGPGTGYTIVGGGGRVRTRLVGTGEPGCSVEVKVSDPTHPDSTRNNATYTATVDASGNWALDLELDDCHPVIEIRQVCDGAAGEVIRREVYIDTTPPTASLSDQTVYVGTGGTATITLNPGAEDHSHVPNNGLSYRWFLVGDGGRTPLCSNCPGIYELVRSPGEHIVEVEVTDAAGNVTTKRCKIVVLKRPTEILCATNSVDFAGMVTLNYTLKDKLTGEVLVRTIKYKLNGNEVQSTFEAYLLPGMYQVVAEFAGDEVYASCSTEGGGCLLEVRSSPGKITGGGSIDERVRNFGFVVQTKSQGGAGTSFIGNMEFQDKARGYNLHSQSVTMIAVSADRSRGAFTGAATLNGAPGYTFTVWVDDLAEPGAQVDKFRIQINGPNGFAYDSSTYATLGGKLDQGGNIQIHKAR